MEFIPFEEFQKQPKHLQKVFLDWWKPCICDLYVYKDNPNKHRRVTDTDNTEGYIGEIISCKNEMEIIPLLTEGQLRKFIEDNGFRIYIKTYSLPNDYGFYCYSKDCPNNSLSLYHNDSSENILQSYWETACRVAENILTNKYKVTWI